MGQSLISYSNPDIVIEDQEEVIILNNADAHLWKIQNSRGQIGEVPSVCIWIPGPDSVSRDKTTIIREKLIKNWEQCLNRFSIILIDYYISLFERVLSDSAFTVANIEQFHNFLRDIEEILLSNSTDIKINELKSHLIELRRKVSRTNSNDLRANRFYKESEIVKMNMPLTKYIDHLKNLRSLRDSVQFSVNINQYREEISRETSQKRYTENIEILNRLNFENKTELDKLIKRLETKPSETYLNQHQKENIRQFSSLSDLKHSHDLHLRPNHFNHHIFQRAESYSSSVSLPNNENLPSTSGLQYVHNFETFSTYKDNHDELLVDYKTMKNSSSMPAGLTDSEIQFVKPKSHHPGRKKVWKVDSQTQLGVTVRDSKIQCSPKMFDEATYIQEDIFSATDSSITSSKNKFRLITHDKYCLDAQTQIGVLFKDSSTQNDLQYTSNIQVLSEKKRKPKRMLIDSETQIGCFIESIGTQTHSEKSISGQNIYLPTRSQMDAMTQISVLLNDRIIQTTHSKSKRTKRDCQTQIGTLQNESKTQTTIHNKSKGIQKSCLQLDAITQMSVLNQDNDVQTDFFEDSELSGRKTVIYLRDNSTDTRAIKHKKNKLIQIGSPRIAPDEIFSNQTYYDISDKLIQTNDGTYDRQISRDSDLWQYEIAGDAVRDTVDVEIQSDLSIVKTKGKKLQYGYSKLFDISDSICQIQVKVENVAIQTEIDQEKYKKVVKSSDSIKYFDKDLINEEIQWENDPQLNNIGKIMKNKKVQIGNSRMEIDFDLACQTGCIHVESESQTASLFHIEEEIKESKLNIEHQEKEIQSYLDVNDIIQQDIIKKSKKIQAGSARLTLDYEVSCQTGHIVLDSYCQTFDDSLDNIESQEIIKLVRSENQSINSDFLTVGKKVRGKKIQVGFPHININTDVACQTLCSLVNVIIQTENKEMLFTDLEEKRQEVIMQDIVDSSNNLDIINVSGKHKISKKLQVGTSRLDNDYDVSCQTGHVVIESSSQTDDTSLKIIAGFINDESQILNSYSEKIESYGKEIKYESSTDESLHFNKIKKSKKIQVGYPRMNFNLDAECQSGHINKEMSIQTEIDEYIVNEISTHNEENASNISKRLDESLQYNNGEMNQIKNKRKKVQVGPPRLNNDFEVGCQTDHVVIESECSIRDEKFDKSSEFMKFGEENEIQSENIGDEIYILHKTKKSKKVQVGHQRLLANIDTGCQSDHHIGDVFIQTRFNDILMVDKNKNEATLIEELIQYENSKIKMILSQKEYKNRKMQVGASRLGHDYEMSCQTGHLVKDSESQTNIERFEKVSEKKKSKEQLLNIYLRKSLTDKEIQSESMCDESYIVNEKHKFKKTQIGYPHIFISSDVECQSERYIDDACFQTDIEEFINIDIYEVRERAPLMLDVLIEEIIQYDNREVKTISNKVESKSKKLQVGISRSEYDLEVSCQTGHLVRESESQTDDESLEIVPKFVKGEDQSVNIYSERKTFSAKEVQSENINEKVYELNKLKKSKTIQVGHSKLLTNLDVGCHSGYPIVEVSIQTDIAEKIMAENWERNEKRAFVFYDLIEKSIQYECCEIKNSKEETKGKKLQVGTPGMGYNYEISCQTGHLVRESECQTNDETVELAPIFMEDGKKYMKSFSKKEFSEKETQSRSFSDEIYVSKQIQKNKNVQIGYPRQLKNLDVGCQSGFLINDATIQAEVDEIIMVGRKNPIEDTSFVDLLEEPIQYDNEEINTISLTKECKRKKLQVGISGLLGYKYEVSCQTGRLVNESESQTPEFMASEADYLNVSLNKQEFGANQKQSQSMCDEFYVSNKIKKTKKLQVGHSLILTYIDGECQSYLPIDEASIQTDVEQIINMNTLQANENTDDLSDEFIQYDRREIMLISLKKETSEKKLQIGISRLDYNYEVSCQTGRLVRESECQTDVESLEIVSRIISAEEQLISAHLKTERFCEKEMQSKNINGEFHVLNELPKFKKNQIGYPRNVLTSDVECQSERFINDACFQTDNEEFLDMNTSEVKEKAALILDNFIEKLFRYDSTEMKTVLSKAENKSKNLQVGISRLDYNYEVSCQTGHLVRESESQTDDESLEIIPKFMKSEKQSVNISLKKKISNEKEIQSEYVSEEFNVLNKIKKSKKIQVGHSRLLYSLDEECQSGRIFSDVFIQTDVDEIIMVERRYNNEKVILPFVDLIEESVQYDSREVKMISIKTESKGKKLQVGTSRFDYEYEVSCQTGHLVTKTECQTDDLVPDYMTVEEQSMNVYSRKKRFCEIEIQSEGISFENYVLNLVQKSKKVQVGHPRLLINLDVECQAGHPINEVSIQTEVNEIMMMERRQEKEEATLLFDDLIEESIQYDNGEIKIISLKTETKGKKLQVGTPRLDYNYEVSCQTGHVVMETECQTEYDSMDIVPDYMTTEEQSMNVYCGKKEFCETEMQSESISNEIYALNKVQKSRNIQVGHPRLLTNLDFECQFGRLVEAPINSELDDIMMIFRNQEKEEGSLLLDDLIEESIQYDSNEITMLSLQKDNKDNKLQVGTPRLDYDYEVSCQTDCLVIESECQTLNNNFEIIHEPFDRNIESLYFQKIIKKFSDNEIQYDISKEEFLLLNISKRSKTVQVGFPRLEGSLDFECQSECTIFDVGIQTDREILLIMQQNPNSKDLSLKLDDMFDEIIQCDSGEIKLILSDKESKGKKLQVGSPRLNIEYDGMCQTDNMMIESESQTHSYHNDSLESTNAFENKEYVMDMNVMKRKFTEIEIQCDKLGTDSLIPIKWKSSKRIQVGYPRLDGNTDIECQVEFNSDHIFTANQTKFHVNTERNQFQTNSNLLFREMVEETMQYPVECTFSVSTEKPMKGKKIQVGFSQVNNDIVNSCQTMESFTDNSAESGIYMNSRLTSIHTNNNHKYNTANLNYSRLDQEVLPEEWDEECVYFNKNQNSSDIEDDALLFDSFTHFECPLNSVDGTFDLQSSVRMKNEYRHKKCDLITKNMLHEINGSFGNGKDFSMNSHLKKEESENHNIFTDNLILDKEMKFYHGNENRLNTNFVKNMGSDLEYDNSEIIRYNEENDINFKNINENNCKDNDVSTIRLAHYIPRYNMLTFDVQFDHFLFNTEVPKENSFTVKIIENPEISDNGNEKIENENIASEFENPEIEGHQILESSDEKENMTYEKLKLLNDEGTEIKRREINNHFENSELPFQMKCVQCSLPLKTYTDHLTNFNSFDSDSTYNDTDKFNNQNNFISIPPRTFPNNKIPTIDISNMPKLITQDFINLFESIAVQVNLDKENQNNYQDLIIYNDTNEDKKCVEALVKQGNLQKEKLNYIEPLLESLEICLAPKSMEGKIKFESIITETNVVRMVDKCMMYKDTQEPLDYPSMVNESILYPNSFTTEHHADPKESDFNNSLQMVNNFKFYTDSKRFNEVLKSKDDTEKEDYPKTVEISLIPKVIDPEFHIKAKTLSTIISPSMKIHDLENNHDTVEINLLPKLIDLQADLKDKLQNQLVYQSDEPILPFFVQKYQPKRLLPTIKDQTTQLNSFVKDRHHSLPKLELDFTDEREGRDKLVRSSLEHFSAEFHINNEQISKHRYFIEYSNENPLKSIIPDRKFAFGKEIQEFNDDELIDILLEKKGLSYFIEKCKIASHNYANSNKSHLLNKNSANLQHESCQFESLYERNIDLDYVISTINGLNGRPSYKNKKTQRGCSSFYMKDAETSTTGRFGDHIEVIYTETLFEESVITKRPVSRLNGHYDYSNNLNFCKKPRKSNMQSKYVQSITYPSQIFLEEDNYEEYLTIIKSIKITAVYDHRSRRYISLKEAIKNGVIKLTEDKYFISKMESINIEKAAKEGHLIIQNKF